MFDRLGFKISAALLLGCGTLVTISTSMARPVPAAASEDHKAAGAELYANRGCAHCHGYDGKGGEKGPSLLNERKKKSADEIRNQIVHGGGGMPAFGEVLQPAEIDNLVTFLRAKKWQGLPAPPATSAPGTQPDGQPPAAPPPAGTAPNSPGN